MSAAQRRSWDDATVEAELRKVADSLGHMPSASEMRGLGRNDLMCAITKRGGVMQWAERIGMERVPSDSDFGWDGERRLVELLSARGFHAIRSGAVTAPFDILVDGVLKIDVKTAKYAEYRSKGSASYSTGWFFRIGKIPTCDVVALHRFDVGDTFFIPWTICGTTNISIMNAEDGKYANYRERYDMLRTLTDGLLSAYRAAGIVISEKK